MKKNLRRISVMALGLSFVLVSLYSVRSENLVMGTTVMQKDTDASVLFEKHCDTCHGKDGQAKTFKAKFNHARNLTDAKWQSEVTDERLFNSITNGKGKMPAWGKKLTEAQINSLVAYVRKLKK
ncbi:MAG TPA: cytochrome c [Pyrinomonadaceae bacterium]|jgi:mono/diheme cytochrome c family protein